MKMPTLLFYIDFNLILFKRGINVTYRHIIFMEKSGFKVKRLLKLIKFDY